MRKGKSLWLGVLNLFFLLPLALVSVVFSVCRTTTVVTTTTLPVGHMPTDIV